MNSFHIKMAFPLSPFWAMYEPAARRLAIQMESIAFAAPETEPEPKPYQMIGATAIIPVTGVMLKRPGPCMGIDQTTIWTRRLVRAAEVDPAVRNTAMIFDSPGGETNGAFELADDVRRLAMSKPVIAYADGLMCSAAYLVASQASEIRASPTSLVGNIGTMLAIEDSSELYQKQGIKVHVISTGDYKGMGADGTVVTESHLAELRRNVNSIQAEFLTAFAQGRGMDMDSAKTLADGRCHVGQEAMDLGLVDGICTFDDLISSLNQPSYASVGTSSIYNTPAAAPAKWRTP